MVGKRAAGAKPDAKPPDPTRPRLEAPTVADPAAPPPPGFLHIMSYNVCSLRSMLKKGTLPSLVDTFRPHVLCLQETKMTDDAVKLLDGPGAVVPGFTVYWNHSTTAKGKHGVATLISDDAGITVSAVPGPGDAIVVGEGRVLALDVTSEQYGTVCVVNAYVPNSGAKLARLPYRTEEFEPLMRSYLAALRKDKGAVVYVGDLNCAHRAIDIHNSKGNSRYAGHTPEERAEFSKLLDGGFVDAFRRRNPDLTGAYTFWSSRSKTTREQNKGWRLDYGIVNEELFPRVHDVLHLAHVDSSDHCPISVLLAPRE
jgi:exodeoxyribonuclease III